MVANLLGLLGACLVLVALYLLAGGCWALLGSGVGLLGLAYSVHTWDQVRRRPAPSSRRS